MSEIRIIGGIHRSRKIIFEEEPGLRPTHNRIRETVFNWLQNTVENSVCLDVFSGSGAMGFEALSRGAKQVTFIDISKQAIGYLKQNAVSLKINKADFFQCDFMASNPVSNKKFDLVFLDPPFQNNLLLKACELLESRELLNSNAIIYCEFEKGSVDISQLPKNWEIKKHKNTQTVEYILAQRL
ncbi:MAG: 16S rRNA (guanine(966)-N(2))-methyltransferase RsmD [Gammaproteobacteria bacterium]|nr:16S rRNA (guanine(966)-N(2))-methyltransferase RsmD [Gammaproteobacteria bacterium]